MCEPGRGAPRQTHSCSITRSIQQRRLKSEEEAVAERKLYKTSRTTPVTQHLLINVEDRVFAAATRIDSYLKRTSKYMVRNQRITRHTIKNGHLLRNPSAQLPQRIFGCQMKEGGESQQQRLTEPPLNGN